jgi:hypothetical protein
MHGPEVGNSHGMTLRMAPKSMQATGALVCEWMCVLMEADFFKIFKPKAFDKITEAVFSCPPPTARITCELSRTMCN